MHFTDDKHILKSIILKIRYDFPCFSVPGRRQGFVLVKRALCHIPYGLGGYFFSFSFTIGVDGLVMNGVLPHI